MYAKDWATVNWGVYIVRVFAMRALIKFPALQMALFDYEIRYGMVAKYERCAGSLRKYK